MPQPQRMSSNAVVVVVARRTRQCQIPGPSCEACAILTWVQFPRFYCMLERREAQGRDGDGDGDGECARGATAARHAWWHAPRMAMADDAMTSGPRESSCAVMRHDRMTASSHACASCVSECCCLIPTKTSLWRKTLLGVSFSFFQDFPPGVFVTRLTLDGRYSVIRHLLVSLR
jgi:hypothetical protein